MLLSAAESDRYNMRMADTYEYDVAVSFLHKDEGVALQIHSRLSPQFSVFVYSKRQEELAGTDGLESFRVAFREKTRLVVVLYRKGWGETPWTRVEQTAITDRCLAEGWEFLLFVMLDDGDAPPKWLPKSEIRLSFQQYGLEQLLGAIKLRAEKLGSAPHVETAIDRAKRLQNDSDLRAERQRRLDQDGREAVDREYGAIAAAAVRKINESRQHLSDGKVEAAVGRDGVLTMRAQNVSVSTYLYITYPVTDTRMIVQLWKGRLMLPTESGFYRREPKVVRESKFFFDYQSANGWCWHPGGRSSEILTSEELAEHLVIELFNLQDRFGKGEIRWSENEI